jgi:peptidoglycan/LPS O-acetylase OafA/YrhL
MTAPAAQLEPRPTNTVDFSSHMAADMPTRPAPGPRLHLTHVEGMRAVAALVVFVNHAYAQVWEWGNPVPVWPVTAFSYFMVLGHFAVVAFIVISGFCLMLPVVTGDGTIRGGARVFFRRRARRILPPYYAALALSLLLIASVIGQPTGTLWDVAIMIRPQDLVSHLVLAQDVFGTGRVNYVFWSIATEWQIYFLFPALVWAWREKGPRATTLATIVGAYALALTVAHTRGVRAHAQLLGMFSLGMLAATICYGRDRSIAALAQRVRWGLLACAAGGVVALVTVGWGWRFAMDHVMALDGLVGIVTLALIVLSSRSERNPLRSLFSWSPLAAVGVFSYSLYLVHAPLLQILWQYWLRPTGYSRDTQFFLLLVVGAPVIVACSYLFYRVAERPFVGTSGTSREKAVLTPVLVPAAESRASFGG